ncbi:acyltransferase family protein [Pseudomonas aeruginosa]|uniref:acyltransferase family protein n=1 Tax=Pseudomonas aeruginosa TaxID=287 RepID=UPI0034D22444
MHGKNLVYRPDIDGLRAIAVLAVILYHFKVPFFTGGFVGVDVFFVISGYLITKGISSQQKKGKFEFSEFYVRRVRRLIPALIFTIATSYVASAILFSPNDFKQMSGSTVYALSGISNIFFWMESGYFDSASIVKPLLHTWSLSVEIQFYIAWPIILLIFTRITQKPLAVIAAITAIGTIAAYVFLRIDAIGSFFLMPLRIHEFLFGALIVFLEKNRVHRVAKKAFYLTGLALVITPIFVYESEKTLFPGLAALVPVAGSALMILGGDSAFTASPLRSWPATKIGEISYSLYLVHWPIFVFASYILMRDLSSTQTAAMLCVTFLAAGALFYFIERPFRTPSKTGRDGKNFVLAALGCTTILIVISSSSWGQNGWEWRIPEELRSITNIDKQSLNKYTWSTYNILSRKNGFEQTGNKEKVLIIGDSQAADVANMLKESGHADSLDIVSRTVFTDCATPMIKNDESEEFFNRVNPMTIKRPELVGPCIEKIAEAKNEDLLRSADRVIVAMFWRPFAIRYNIEAIKTIKSMTRANVYIVGRKDLSKSSIDIVSSLGRTAGLNGYAARFQNPDVAETTNLLSKIPGVTFIDMMKITCPAEDSCIVLTDDKRPIFFDNAHLTKEGAKYVGSSFASEIGSI